MDDDESEQSGSEIYKFRTLVDDDEGEQSVSEIYEFKILMDKLFHEKNGVLRNYQDLLRKYEGAIVLRLSLESNKKFLEDDLRHFSVERILDYPRDPNYLRLKRALELSSISSQNRRNRQPSIPAKASSSSSSTPADTTSTASNSIQPRRWPGKSESTLMSKKAGSDYDVFLSFCGDDTRKGFTDHLYNALAKEGVRTFRDNEDLPVGEEIKPELLEAIKMSKIGIPIFSKGYVSSKWCLLELAEMSRRKSTKNLKIFPVFYNVMAEDVKLKTETFKDALLKHEANELDKETVKEWKAALQNVPAVKGWERGKIDTGHESTLVDVIVKCVSSKLKIHTVKLPEHLVGMRHHYNKMMERLNFDADEVQIVVICGMGGIGKTTIARCMYNQLCESFQRFSFIANIRETAPEGSDAGLMRLQNQLLSVTTMINSVDEGINTIKARFGRKKVLVVLDDVDQKFQLDALAGNKDWFGRGSRIIITTRDKELSKKLEVSDIYEPEVMNLDKSLKLFSKHAFNSTAPPEAFVKLSTDIVSSGGGLPLFLEVVGAYLYDKDVEIWEETFVKLKKCVDDEPNRRIQKQLKISYDALTRTRKEIFLDVACHFVGTSTKNPYYMWTALELFPKSAIDGLCNLALLKVDEHDNLRMHDLLRDLGRFIVSQENEEPCERTRLWSREDVQQVLEDKTGTPKTLTLSANAELKASPDTYPGETFVNLIKLRYLQMDNTSLDGAFNGPLSNLRWLRWKRFPSNISFSDFLPRNLVILDLSYSEISWELLGQFKMAKNLKVLKLTGCKKLIRTPDFSTFKELERLDLYGCTNLKEIHHSIVFLKSLVYFSIDSCSSVRELPKEIGRLKDLEEVHLDSTGISDIPVFGENLEKLKTFKASDCKSLIQVSPSIVRLCSLSYLNLNGTGITELPDFISSLQKLRRLSLYKCELLIKLPDSIGLLVLLEDLDLFGCSSLNKLPETIGNLKKLNKLSISGTKIKILPNGIGMLQNLEKFIPWDFSFSERELPKWIWELSSLKMLKLDGDKISSLSDKICGFSNLSTLDLRCCSNVMLPKVFKLPQCLTKLHIPFTGASLDAAVGLRNLKRLGFNHSCLAKLKPVHGLRDLSLLSKLEKLTFFGVKEIYSLQKIMPLYSLPCLKEFEVILCKNLRFLPDMPKSLRSLCLEKCDLISRLTNLSNLKKLSRLQVYNCDGLTEFPGLGGAERLTLLNIIDCRRLSNLVGLQHLRHLEELRIVRCNSLKSLPDLSGLGKLKTLCVRDIPELTKILGLQALSLVEDLNLSDCKSLKGVLSLSGKKELRRLQIHACKKVAKILDLDVDTLEYFRDQEGLVFYHGKPSGEVDVFDLKKYVRSQKPPCPRHIPKSSGYTKEELPRHVNLWVEKVEDEILSLRQSSPTEKPREGNDSDEEPLAVVRYNSDDDDFVV